MDELTKLSNKYGCDKSDKRHRYTQIYDRYFNEYRHKNFNMLELGFGQGKSVKMWLEYFTKAKLFTVDIRDTLPDDKLIQKYVSEGRFEFISADQTDKQTILDRVGNIPFYMIIDDASHVAEHQQYTMSFLFPLVIPAGWYVIEDLKCKRNPQPHGGYEAEKTLKVLHDYNKNGFLNSRILTFQEHRPFKQIASIRVYDKVAFIKKKVKNEH